MVPKSFNTSASIRPGRRLLKLLIIAVVIMLTVGSLVFYILNLSMSRNNDNSQDNNTTVSDSSLDGVTEPYTDPNDKTNELPSKVDFQTSIDNFVQSSSGNKSVIIYDLERQELAGEYNALDSYNTASLYKLFVVYEGYKRIETGVWNPSDLAGSTGFTILECLDRAIRSSDSPCAETLWRMIGHQELDNLLVSTYNIQNSNISSLLSNVEDILAIMKLFYYHPDITSDALLSQIKDSFLNQPPVNGYNWRQGLPSGFKRANVYNKVGWEYNPSGSYWNLYHDAAVVEFPEENRHFIVVVMTQRVPFQNIAALGASIEESFYQKN